MSCSSSRTGILGQKIIDISKTLVWPFAPLLSGTDCLHRGRGARAGQVRIACLRGYRGDRRSPLRRGSLVDWNHLYDLVIALVLIMALATHRLGERLADAGEHRRCPPCWRSSLRWAFCFRRRKESRRQGQRGPRSQNENPAFAVDVAYLAAQTGPVLWRKRWPCVTGPGRPTEADILELRRKLLAGKMTEQRFARLSTAATSRCCSFIARSTGRTKRLPEPANEYISQQYESRPNAMGGRFPDPESFEVNEAAPARVASGLSVALYKPVVSSVPCGPDGYETTEASATLAGPARIGHSG